jgi:UDP-N-acetylglucosamine 1-carboxyvinyltransferase
MEYITIQGGAKLKGEVIVSGSKNSALPILASSLLTDKKLSLTNVPKLVDVLSMTKLIKSLGVNIETNQKGLILKTTQIKSRKADYNLVRQMRASFLVLGPLLAREGYAEVSLPGGCAIGSRPVDLHLQAMKSLGATIDFSDGYIIAKTDKNRLLGGEISFPKISVGATENAIMAAVLAKGETVIHNAAREPEIIDLCNCLVSMGAIIEGIGSNKIELQGVTSLLDASHKVISDRIEACTFIIAAAITRSTLKIKNINFSFIKKFLEVMDHMGLDYFFESNDIIINPVEELGSVKIKTEEFPGFPTDLQAQLMTLACLSKGVSEIEENIFENRFMHVPELNRLGADIKIMGSKAIIKGNRKFIGAEVMATDLRASVSLILAGLVAEGKTKINRIYHLDRGYENIDSKLSLCGASVIRGN